MEHRHAQAVEALQPGDFDVVLDNIRAATWTRWGIDPHVTARRLNVRWASMRDDFDGRSFDAIAQARAWGDHHGYVPFYIGDTSAGLWLAFKALNLAPGEHGVVRQAACLAKLVEGELVVTSERDGVTPPWDEPGTYGFDGHQFRVEFKGETVAETAKDDAWRHANLAHRDGRYTI